MTAITTTPKSATPTGFSLTCVSFASLLPGAYRRRVPVSLGPVVPPTLWGMTERRLRAVAAGPLSEELAQRIRDAEPRLDLVVEQDLLPPQLHPGDHAGDPDFS